MGMEEVIQSFTFTLKSLLQEQQKTNQLLEKITKPEAVEIGKNDEFLTIKDIIEEYGLKRATLDKLFNSQDFPAIANVKPKRVSRKAFEEYLSKRHEKED